MQHTASDCLYIILQQIDFPSSVLKRKILLITILPSLPSEGTQNACLLSGNYSLVQYKLIHSVGLW